MQRRQFLSFLATMPIVGYAAVSLAQARDGEDTAEEAAAGSLQSFGYYQGLGEDETRDPGRTDGTDYHMPCISGDDIAKGVEKTYDFWHGHSSIHKFTVTAEHFKALQQGQPVELFTSIVDDHRHALLISPRKPCAANCPVP